MTSNHLIFNPVKRPFMVEVSSSCVCVQVRIGETSSPLGGGVVADVALVILGQQGTLRHPCSVYFILYQLLTMMKLYLLFAGT